MNKQISSHGQNRDSKSKKFLSPEINHYTSSYPMRVSKRPSKLHTRAIFFPTWGSEPERFFIRGYDSLRNGDFAEAKIDVPRCWSGLNIFLFAGSIFCDTGS
jgi:hypothetical protein